MSSGT
ncbi:hypothetical protein E2C01_087770 [Portunus trituberculatus]